MSTKVLTPSETQKLLSTPGYVPWQINGGQAQIIFRKLDESTLYNAAFLDQRLVRTENETLYSIPIAGLLNHQGDIKPPQNWIFHTSFCCSTLLARLLQTEDRILSLKEPVILNQLADAFRQSRDNASQYHLLFKQIARQLSKPFHNQQTIILKTSNYMNALLNQVQHINNDSRILLVWGGVRDFARSMLKNRSEAIKTMPVFLAALQRDIDNKSGYIPGTDFTHDIAHMWAVQIRLFSEFIQNTPLQVAAVKKQDIVKNTRSVVAASDQFFGVGEKRDIGVIEGIMDRDSKRQNDQPSIGKVNQYADQDKSMVDSVEKVALGLIADNALEVLDNQSLQNY